MDIAMIGMAAALCLLHWGSALGTGRCFPSCYRWVEEMLCEW